MKILFKIKFITLLFIAFNIQFYLIAQKGPMKFGKINIDDLRMTVYEKDPSADAVILGDYGNSYFIYSEKDGFQLKFDRHTRIKIINKNGFDWATVSVKLYHDKSQREKFTNFKGRTYNLEKGKIVKDKIPNADVFTEEYDDNSDLKKFTMPNVKEGSIIEYSYTIISDFLFNLWEWKFQTSIPIIWSEYRTKIPEYFYYKRTVKGYQPFYINENNRSNEKFTYNYESKFNHDFNDPRSSGGTASFEVISDYQRLVTKDVPALKEEKYITSIDNYLTQIEFELSSIQLPGRTIKDYTGTWTSINELLLENDKFGGQLNKRGFIKDNVAEICNNLNTPEEKMFAIFEFVKKHMKWNNKKRIYVNKNLNNAYKEKSGNSADINLLLDIMLCEAGLDAYPVLLSTRDHGIIHPSHPAISKFNYVIVMVKINEKKYLLDATSPLYPVNMLPYRCLNDKARIISKTKSDWLKIKATHPYNNITMANLTIDEDGNFVGNYESTKKGYAALNFRKNLLKKKNEDDFIKKIQEQNVGLSIEDYLIENTDSIYKPIKLKYSVVIEDHTEMIGDMIYFNPMLYSQETENPFKLEERKFPIDYGYPIQETFILKLTLPEDYIIEEKPDNSIISLPDKGGKFSYSITQTGNILQVMSQYTINKTFFLPDQYTILKEFYNQIINKHAQQIVLTKKPK